MSNTQQRTNSNSSTYFENIKHQMRRQWCGCGAIPGMGLEPSSFVRGMPETPGDRQGVRPMTLPGYGVGAHGYELGATANMPNICADYPLIYQLPDSSFNLDPMDSRLWGPSTECHHEMEDPWAPWGYALGPKV